MNGFGAIATGGWYRARVQFGGAVVYGLLLPFAVATLVSPRILGLPLFLHSFLAGLAGLMTGYHLLRSITRFPGITAAYYILPVFGSSSALAVLTLFFLRLEYSRPLLIASFVLTVAWFYLVYFRTEKGPGPRIGIVPFGEVDSLRAVRDADWVPLDAPATPPGCRAVVADFRADMPDEWQAYLAEAALSGVGVFHVKQLRESLTGQVQIEHLSENAGGTLVPQPAYLGVKSAVDRVVAVAALLVAWPVLLAVAAAVRFGSPGPVLFRQRRVGYRGLPFEVWKFRTMAHRDGAAAGDPREEAITRHNDRRITPVGRFLRRTRLDELPQLVNVARGEMSFIGPRPEAEVLSHWYRREIPFYRYRHIVRPGITGWAQVNQGHVADVEAVNSKLHYDFYYIMNFSLWLDILILIRTVRTVLTGFGSK